MKITNKRHLKEMLTEHFKVKILESLGLESTNKARRSDNSEGDYDDEGEGDGVSYDESVDRSRRGEDKSGDAPHDYPEESEGPGTTYEHLKFDRDLFETNLYHQDDTENAGKDGKPPVDETNLYSDDDEEGTAKGVSETNLYSDADTEKVPGKEDITNASAVGSTHIKSLEDKKSYSGGSDLGETNLYSDADEEGEDDVKQKGKGHAAPSDQKGKFPGPPHGMGEGKFPSLKSIFSEGTMLGLAEVAPPGWEKTVKKMKGEKDIDNPWTLSWHRHNKDEKGEKKEKK